MNNRGKEIIKFLILAACLCLGSLAKAQDKTIVYPPADDDFPNPERGFYMALSEKAGELSADELIKLRTIHSVKSPKAVYATWITLIYKGYLLTDFREDTISKDYLQKLDQDFAAIRKAGVKVILRFSYTDKSRPGNCPDKAICPPYGDASKEIVLKHIAQLKPVIQKNTDVIAVVQQGFIGIWGENYYTDYFGDGSDNSLGYIADSCWNDRQEMLKTLLDAVPKNRMVQVRTPQIKQRFVYGPKSPVSSAALLKEEAFTGLDKSRVAFHNDCFFSSIDDYGTFADYGNSTSPRAPANEILRTYFKADSRYVAVGGETCDDTFSPQNDCSPLGHAEQEMATMHYSFLNVSYNNLVNNDWETQGCMLTIKKSLGYRFVLKEAVFPVKTKLNDSLKIAIKLENTGYASPYNPRPVELILRNRVGGKTYIFLLRSNGQKWFTGNSEIKESVKLPGDFQPGQYELLINLPDEFESLKGRPEYSIRFANQNIWEDQTGFNKLNHILTIY